jgi:hypothetical protein
MDPAYPPVHQIPFLQPVPAESVPPVVVDWEPWDKRLMSASMLPAPCFSPPASLYTGCPEAVLMQAVLDDALACFQRQCATKSRGVRQEAREAEGWLFSDDAHGLFSYMYVCAVLGLEPESIRQELMRWSQAQPRTRQHSRATRHTQTDQAWQPRSCRRPHRSTVRRGRSSR